MAGIVDAGDARHPSYAPSIIASDAVRADSETVDEATWCERDESVAALIAVSAVFESFHRVLLCLDSDFRIVHASSSLRKLIGDETAAALVKKPAHDPLGPELFDAGAPFRHALKQHESREGRRASPQLQEGRTRLVTVTAAPIAANCSGHSGPPPPAVAPPAAVGPHSTQRTG